MPVKPLRLFSLFFVAASILLLAVHHFSEILPPYWPDEALFSSPAASLAQNGSFATPVLQGLIPGMERATLWNSPLFMYLLAQIYRFTGESLFVARLFSTVLALLVIWIFLLILGKGGAEPRSQIWIVLALVLDLSFLRSANTARMDMLTLLWILGALYFWITESRAFCASSTLQAATFSRLKAALLAPLSWKSRLRFLASGICVGLAASSHPFAVILLPIALVYVLPRLRPLAWIALGAVFALLPWLSYILRHPDLFWLQFQMQLKRKRDIFDLFGGDTGGAFKVFLSQYGGGRWLMLLALLWIASALFWMLWTLRKELSSSSSTFSIKVFFSNAVESIFFKNPILKSIPSFFVVFSFVILSSEGWYALYVGPFLLLALASTAQSQDRPRASLQGSLSDRLPPLFRGFLMRRDAPLILNLAWVFLLFSGFAIREEFVWKRKSALLVWQANVLDATKQCPSVYLRLRPDPYFLLRKKRPKLEILEFVPGKLKLPVGYEELKKRYDSIGCFLLNREMAWEPFLERYLTENRSAFRMRRLRQPPFEEAFLFERRL